MNNSCINAGIVFPPRIDGAPVPEVSPQVRRIVVIGANGSGKSRFASWMLESSSDGRAFEISALRAIYGGVGRRRSDIDSRYEAMAADSLLRGDLSGELERLIALMLDEEGRALFAAKYAAGTEPVNTPSRLDRLIEMWEAVFPDNKMLIESGRVLFTQRRDQADRYDQMRLSDGEKAVIYYLGCSLMTDPGRVMVVDNPGMFLNRAVMGRVWDMAESLRMAPVVYVTHNIDFATIRASMPGTMTVWVKRYDAALRAWDYEVLPPGSDISEDVMVALLGARKPVLFIEGDGVNSIDAKLYPMVFKDYSVKSLGSCNKVIEATRTFNSLEALHSLAATGIVDRDRRNEREVSYLRRHNVLVPEVAEIENILMLEDVVRAVAVYNGRRPERAFSSVKRTLLKLFAGDVESQALQHTRHHVKMTVEYTIDRRFDRIGSLERHLSCLVREIEPRAYYNALLKEFRGYINNGDYASVLKVYNRKSMISETNVASLTGCQANNRRSYIDAVLDIVAGNSSQAETIAVAVKRCFGLL